MDHLTEDPQALPAPLRDMHRANAALIDALRQLDADLQRHEACTDPELKLLFGHLCDRSRKNAAMLLEWMRRRDVHLNHELRGALFKAGPIVAPFRSDEEDEADE
jgi:hypothetical protein